MDHVQARLKRLERDNRFLKLVIAIAVVALGSLALSDPPDNHVETQAIVIVDPDGRERVRIGEVLPGRYGVAVLDEKETIRAWLRLMGGSPSLAMADADGRVRSRYGVYVDKGPALEMWDTEMTPRVTLQAYEDSIDHIIVRNTTGEVALVAP